MQNNCDIIIPVHNQLEHTKICIESIWANTEPIYRMIVVDDCSSKESSDYLDKLAESGKILLSRNKVNLGWVGSVNNGLKLAKAEYVCVMNNDTRVFPGWLFEMVNLARLHKSIGLVNPCWELPRFWPFNFEEYFKKMIVKRKGEFVETDWVRGFCFLIKKEVIEKIGGLNELFAPGYFDDWDYSLRAVNSGFISVRASGAFVWHFGNVTYKEKIGNKGMCERFNEKKVVFEKKWGKPLRILFLFKPADKKCLNQVSDFVLRLLRSQNKLVVITNIFAFSLKHTNCGIKKSPGFFMKMLALAHIYDNFKRALSKRYDIILCSPDMKSFLEGFAYIRNNFSFLVLNGGLDNEKELFTEIERLKRK